MTAKRTDANQAEIVAALRKAGCSVQDIHTVGKGCPDILVGHAGRCFVFECKVKGGRLTDDEQKWWLAWRGQWDTIYSAEDALRIMGLIKEAA